MNFSPSVLVVGSSNTDLIVRVPRLPAPGETVLGSDLATAAGGKGANQAVAAARLGARVTFVARVGADAYGRAALAQFQREGLDTRFVTTDSEAPSGAALIVVGPNGQNQIAVAPGANLRLTPADVEAARPAFEQGRVLLLQLESPVETVLAAARLGRAHGLTVILNPAPAQALPDELYSLSDVLTPNEREAGQLTGEQSPEDAASVLLDRGAGSVIVTLGEAGALLATREALHRVPGFPVAAVDATAAGDAFNGALAVALARGEPLPAAVRRAHAAAAIAVTRQGAQPSLPTAEEVDSFLENAS
jgi:ribokinase